MMRFAVLALFLLAPLVSAQEAATPAAPAPKIESVDFLGYKPWDVRMGIGSMLGPELFLLAFSAEAHLDKFLSIGPMIQLGFGNEQDIQIPTFGGRLRWPFFGIRRAEFSAHTGVGWISRNQNGFRFDDFCYEAGFNLDAYPLDELEGLSAGIGGGINLTSSRVEPSLGSLYASLAYRF